MEYNDPTKWIAQTGSYNPNIITLYERIGSILEEKEKEKQERFSLVVNKGKSKLGEYYE